MGHLHKTTGLRRLINAFGYSLAGLKSAFRDEAAFRQEAVAVCILTPLAFYLAPDRLTLALMLGSLFVILITELLNTAVEAAIDRQGEEIHPLAKKAKDTGSAAVLLAIGLAVVIWGLAIF